jgi:fatty acid desaturase
MNEKTQQQIRTIILEVREIYESYRSKNTWTTHQDIIGLGILISCQALLIGLSYAWFIGFFPTWLTIVSIAFITSILHELEHDLIHDLYFKRTPLLYHFMMLGVYIFRPISLNPWIRKYWHHFHHQHSGMPFDIEERGITNGDRLIIIRNPQNSKAKKRNTNRIQ